MKTHSLIRNTLCVTLALFSCSSAFARSEKHNVNYSGNKSRVEGHGSRSAYQTDSRRVLGFSVLGKNLQRALAIRGFYRGPVDGVIGPMTTRSIIAFKVSEGIPATDEINGTLLRALRL